MAVILYHNGFSSEMSHAASDHADLVGTTVIEVWSELQVFETHRARRAYFQDAGRAHHVMTVIHEEFDGVKKWMFMYDDAEQVMFAPMDTLPSDSELEQMLLDLIGG